MSQVLIITQKVFLLFHHNKSLFLTEAKVFKLQA